MNKLQISQNKIRICAWIVGSLIGAFICYFLWTDFSYVENYYSYTLFHKSVVDVELKQLFFFIVYYEMKKIVILNFICITKYRRYLIPVFFLYSGLQLTIQLWIAIKMMKYVVFSVVMINTFEKGIQILFIYMAENYIMKYEQMIGELWKYRISIFFYLLLVSVAVIGGISAILSIIFKYFLF